MTETIEPLDIGCFPEAAVSGAMLVASEYATFLTFNAQQKSGDTYVDAGIAIVAFAGCFITKFGYPNDEAWHAIPRTRGLSYEAYEVMGSSWIDELVELNRHAFPETQPWLGLRHFLFLFHDSSFECIARGISVSLTSKPPAEVLTGLSAKVLQE